MIKSKSMMKLQKLQQILVMIIQLVANYHYQLVGVDLSKQKGLDADQRAIQQIEFCGMLDTNSQVSTVLEKSKETVL